MEPFDKTKNTEDILQYVESHLLRANIARILGLIEILKLGNMEDREEIIGKLEIQVTELKTLVNEMKNDLPALLKHYFLDMDQLK
ncbi:MAG: hypothetical protein HC819_16965 [Cyclobacteriaceae bacterium]|nr:hypothetical protein [Cyclobacteriaceae bacterium]